ncbi:MAG: EF-hand domain-containing protein [Phycisphaerae bacterium]
MKRAMPAISGLGGLLFALTLGMNGAEKECGHQKQTTVTGTSENFAFVAQTPEAPARVRRGERGQGGADADAAGPRRPRGNRENGEPAKEREGRGGGPLMRALDTDADNVLSKTEIANAAASLNKLDKNNDGQITPDEIVADAKPGREAGQRGNLQERMKRMDKNGDGKLSKEEAPARMQENWDRLDANGDGVLDAGELEKIGNRRAAGNRGPRRGGQRGGDGARP